MNEILRDPTYKILLGVLFLVIGAVMFYYTYNEHKKLEKDDYIRTSFQIRKYTGAIIFFLGGVFLLITEILKAIN